MNSLKVGNVIEFRNPNKPDQVMKGMIYDRKRLIYKVISFEGYQFIVPTGYVKEILAGSMNELIDTITGPTNIDYKSFLSRDID